MVPSYRRSPSSASSTFYRGCPDAPLSDNQLPAVVDDAPDNAPSRVGGSTVYAWYEGFSLVEPRKALARDVIGSVAAWHGFSLADILGHSRRRDICVARYDAIEAVWYNCRLGGNRLSLNVLGRLFNRDHTTILHALQSRGIMKKEVDRHLASHTP